MNTWRSRLLAVLFPERCAACGEVIVYGQGFCPRCMAGLRRMEPPICPWCGREERGCRCGKHKTAYERCVMPFAYQGSVKQGIQRLKRQGRSYAAAAFAREMAVVVRREYADIAFTCVTPVPMYGRAQKERGYNQAALLARALAEELALPCRETLVKQTDTRPQKTLSAQERTGNLLGVFDVRDETAVQGETVLLVDDVATTGATLNECAKMLKLYGAKGVWAVTAAGTLFEERDGGSAPA